MSYAAISYHNLPVVLLLYISENLNHALPYKLDYLVYYCIRKCLLCNDRNGKTKHFLITVKHMISQQIEGDAQNIM